MFLIGILSVGFRAYAQDAGHPVIEVSGTATLNIVPDRITVEIGLEEYFTPVKDGDSTKVGIDDLEKKVRGLLRKEGVADSSVTLSDVGNVLDPSKSRQFLMAKRLSVVLSDFRQLDALVPKMGIEGIRSFTLSRIDNSDMEAHNRRGLKAALDAAREKAAFIAGNEHLRLLQPYEIVENGPNYYEAPSFSNVQLQYDGGSGMESMRRIVRRYSVRVKYLFGVDS